MHKLKLWHLHRTLCKFFGLPGESNWTHRKDIKKTVWKWKSAAKPKLLPHSTVLGHSMANEIFKHVNPTLIATWLSYFNTLKMQFTHSYAPKGFCTLQMPLINNLRSECWGSTREMGHQMACNCWGDKPAVLIMKRHKTPVVSSVNQGSDLLSWITALHRINYIWCSINWATQWQALPSARAII